MHPKNVLIIFHCTKNLIIIYFVFSFTFRERTCYCLRYAIATCFARPSLDLAPRGQVQSNRLRRFPVTMGSSYFSSSSTVTFVVYGPFPASNLINFVYDECLGSPRLGFPSNFPPTTTFSRACVACSFFTPTVFRMSRFFRSCHTIHRPDAFIFCPGILHTPFASNAQKFLFSFCQYSRLPVM